MSFSRGRGAVDCVPFLFKVWFRFRQYCYPARVEHITGTERGPTYAPLRVFMFSGAHNTYEAARAGFRTRGVWRTAENRSRSTQHHPAFSTRVHPRRRVPDWVLAVIKERKRSSSAIQYLEPASGQVGISFGHSENRARTSFTHAYMHKTAEHWYTLWLTSKYFHAHIRYTHRRRHSFIPMGFRCAGRYRFGWCDGRPDQTAGVWPSHHTLCA